MYYPDVLSLGEKGGGDTGGDCYLAPFERAS